MIWCGYRRARGRDNSLQKMLCKELTNASLALIIRLPTASNDSSWQGYDQGLPHLQSAQVLPALAFARDASNEIDRPGMVYKPRQTGGQFAAFTGNTFLSASPLSSASAAALTITDIASWYDRPRKPAGGHFRAGVGGEDKRYDRQEVGAAESRECS